MIPAARAGPLTVYPKLGLPLLPHATAPKASVAPRLAQSGALLGAVAGLKKNPGWIDRDL